jgi:hypothetical protein
MRYSNSMEHLPSNSLQFTIYLSSCRSTVRKPKIWWRRMIQTHQSVRWQGRIDILLCIRTFDRYYNDVYLKELAPSTIFSTVQQPLMSQGLLIIGVSRSHSDTLHSIGLLWKSGKPDAETSTWHLTPFTQNNTSTPLARFESTIPVSEQPQIHVLGRATTEIGSRHHYVITSLIEVKRK